MQRYNSATSMLSFGFSALGLLAACGSLPDHPSRQLSTVTNRAQPAQVAPVARANQPATKRQKIRHAVKTILVEFGEDNAYPVPDAFIESVHDWITTFTETKHRQWFVSSLRRMKQYKPLMTPVFSEKRLPSSLFYMALIESGFQPNARSGAGAAGLWQFMPATARQYGLIIDKNQDQRLDPALSTTAAREYILDLIMEFGDGHGMLLVLAAYNAGENRIRRQLRQLDDYRKRHFWALVENRLIPRETRDYVPKIIAAAVIDRYRSLFNISI